MFKSSGGLRLLYGGKEKHKISLLIYRASDEICNTFYILDVTNKLSLPRARSALQKGRASQKVLQFSSDSRFLFRTSYLWHNSNV